MCHCGDYELENLRDRGELREEDLDELLPDGEREAEPDDEPEPATPPADD